eukprot:670605-Ditylum_brightwellii.AAC.1
MPANSWEQHYFSLPVNKDGNKLITNFSLVMLSTHSVEDSAHNVGDTLAIPENKVATLAGLDKNAAVVKVNIDSAMLTVKIATPTLDKLEIWVLQEEVALIPIPAVIVTVTFKGSAMFLPAPWLQEAIFESDKDNLFELIPVALLSAKSFDSFHVDTNLSYPGKATNHANAFILWAWG